MAILRNLAPRLVAFDVHALGTQTHRGGVGEHDPQTGLRAFREHVRELPKSLTFAACANKRAPLHEAIARGEAIDGLPDEVVDDSAVKARVARGTMTAEKTPEPTQEPTTHEEVSQ